MPQFAMLLLLVLLPREILSGGITPAGIDARGGAIRHAGGV
ncbi:hypothetical protein AKL17_3p0013 (plasmid) [Frigidibacter mobilis]|uniref:Uncharacterized protein n=1 Tax=Frigidibacter mobilis TaxID=1335048 RepID=A0A165SXJ4_9RHOB|nr:hypothetical protein AKL17_3p0013 [Frigidibacter mobilis]